MEEYLLKQVFIIFSFLKSNVFIYLFSIILGNIKCEKFNIDTPS
ncbi:hypothetical protein FH603_5861 [Spirosoma sp. LMG 31447]|uniref:Uncharacterized protein n=1 Tax=Spirosoma utsteinense TaxID=2585773 RepID=A0ABR6WGT9_9BACT|nr:hypothetical protein [Spirosoma utsteinense]